MEKNLFRTEVLQAIKTNKKGSVYRVEAFPFSAVTWSLILLVPILLLFMALTPYTAYHAIRGYVDTNQGITRVYPIEPGIIHKYWITPNQFVKKGQKLLCVHTHLNHLSSAEQKRLFSQLTHNKVRLQHTLEQKKQYLRSLKPLLEKRYISQNTFQAVQDEILHLQQTLNDLYRAISKEKHANHHIIRAPISGIISRTTLKAGQQLHLSHAILDIIPQHSIFIIQFAIPASQIGYIKKNDRAHIRYDAYQAQDAESIEATIQTIDQTTTIEPDPQYHITDQEPYYKATASLHQAFVLVHGIKQPIHLGMGCTVIIRGERKKIWQWILDPLNQLSQ